MKFFNLCLISATLICFFIISCATPIQEVNRGSKNPLEIKKIVLIPFFSQPGYSEEESTSYPVTSEKEQFLTNALYNGLASKEKRVNIVSIEISASEFADVKKESPSLTSKDTALKVGKGLGADAILIGNIFVYREREGTELSVVSPASVAFDVQLLNTADGGIIWETYFTETQKPLLENVGEVGKFIKRKGKWVTADELAKEGVEEIADKLSKFLEQK
jgi:peptidoglycan-synthase activator LpoB